MPDYTKIRTLLEKKLVGSAYRRGASTHRLGLIPEGVSDHVPIKMFGNLGEFSTNLISWNLLADTHLYNNFMNITGTQQLLSAISEYNIYGGSENANKLYHYFSEIGQFLYNNRINNQVVRLDKTLLEQFNSLEHCESLLTRSRDPIITKKKNAQTKESREEIAHILLNPEHENAHEFQLAIQHSVDLIYHIKHDDGALKWSNRFKKLQNNKELISTLIDADFICLQECTNPDDIQSLLPKKHCLMHRVNETTNDHCVLFYDHNKFKIIGEPLFFGLDHGKKPCIIARFENIEFGTPLIVGSIHYPGGTEYFSQEIIDKINLLKLTVAENILFYLPGDYNHSFEFFNASPSLEYQLVYPALGTMAGADYGNNNKSIDAVLTNASTSQVNVERVHYIPISQPAELSLRVQFKDEYAYRASAYSFNIQVQREVLCEEANNAVDDLGQNNATYAPQISL